MPIYAYRCTDCGHESEVLRKISSIQTTTCPECGGDHFAKQLTAPSLLQGGSPRRYECGAAAAGGALPPCQGGSGFCPSH